MGVVGLFGMVRCAMFVPVFYLIMFLYVPFFSFVLGFGTVCLWLYCWVELQVRLMVLPMFYVWFIIVFGVCYVCVVICSGVPTVFSVYRAVSVG